MNLWCFFFGHNMRWKKGTRVTDTNSIKSTIYRQCIRKGCHRKSPPEYTEQKTTVVWYDTEKRRDQ